MNLRKDPHIEDCKRFFCIGIISSLAFLGLAISVMVKLK
jgi:hypothetical protein